LRNERVAGKGRGMVETEDYNCEGIRAGNDQKK